MVPSLSSGEPLVSSATMGVELSGKEKMWKSSSGLMGCIIGSYRHGEATDLEIATLIQEREKARKDNDCATSDLIRDALKRAGVDIMDKRKLWRAVDGRQGPIPTWEEEVKGGILAGAMVASSHQATLAQAQIDTADLKTLLVQEAMRAAMHPIIGQQALLLHRQLKSSAGLAQGNIHPSKGSAEMPAEVKVCFESIKQSVASGISPTEEDINAIVVWREQMRQRKYFMEADQIRDVLKEIGVGHDLSRTCVVLLQGKAVHNWDPFVSKASQRPVELLRLSGACIRTVYAPVFRIAMDRSENGCILVISMRTSPTARLWPSIVTTITRLCTSNRARDRQRWLCGVRFLEVAVYLA